MMKTISFFAIIPLCFSQGADYQLYAQSVPELRISVQSLSRLWKRLFSVYSLSRVFACFCLPGAKTNHNRAIRGYVFFLRQCSKDYPKDYQNISVYLCIQSQKASEKFGRNQ